MWGLLKEREEVGSGVRRRRRSRLMLIPVVVTSLALAGCLASTEVSVPTLERERTVQDALPEGVFDDSEPAGDGPDVSTSRFVGEIAGVQVFLARSLTPQNVCVIFVETTSTAGASCGRPIGVQGSNGHVEVRMTSDGIIPQDDNADGDADVGEWVVLNDDVLARTIE
jgi:hypothetical protein